MYQRYIQKYELVTFARGTSRKAAERQILEQPVWMDSARRCEVMIEYFCGCATAGPSGRRSYATNRHRHVMDACKLTDDTGKPRTTSHPFVNTANR